MKEKKRESENLTRPEFTPFFLKKGGSEAFLSGKPEPRKKKWKNKSVIKMARFGSWKKEKMESCLLGFR
ncbi:MAG: hypothetical protein COV69_03205 [Parcubacteria group bacterium CG11_big_fil_rev_8_21_14_0_20_39_14]|nr:MAG: hypothetical protein COV69_03205 [Parcubacteria group bacterium CG11_big_fil_rev_8_21_14_0_20_39_14]PIS34947.1 MAG: hypothetical protein COT36_04930 [Parcubacteria group bacterium CG08_land_8_20_14_0_20_38_56]